MKRLRTRVTDWYWHRLYWLSVRFRGVKDERTTDLAERCIDSRMAVWASQRGER